ncbi:MAG: hypothetical protein V3V88_04410 [Dehalococcoidia bacterium]
MPDKIPWNKEELRKLADRVIQPVLRPVLRPAPGLGRVANIRTLQSLIRKRQQEGR